MLRPTSGQVANSQRNAKGTEPFVDLESKQFPKPYRHDTVDHSIGEYVRGDVHTGTIDNYWGLLKRGLIGSYHRVSIKHLHRYLSKFQYRWNNKEQQDMFTLVIAQLLIASAMEYKTLTSGETASEPF